MREMGWTYEELMECPYEKYLDITRIMSLESKETKRKQKKIK